MSAVVTTVSKESKTGKEGRSRKLPKCPVRGITVSQHRAGSRRFFPSLFTASKEKRQGTAALQNLAELPGARAAAPAFWSAAVPCRSHIDERVSLVEMQP